MSDNKGGYTATPVACGWAGAVFEAGAVRQAKTTFTDKEGYRVGWPKVGS